MDRPPPPRPAIIVHAGAWDIPDDEKQAHREGVLAAVEAGWSALAAGDRAIDVILTTVRVLEDNDELRSKMESLNFQPVEFFQLDIGGGVIMDAWMLRPSGFDPDRVTFKAA